MAYLDPGEAFDNFRDRTLEAIAKQFPVDGRLQTLSLERLEVQDDKSPFDLRAQHKAKVSGETWGVPVYAHLVLTDKATGKEVKARTRIAELPKMTRRYSQILEGNEYQVDNQWQLKPGAYVRRRVTGQIETQFQSAKHSFDVTFDDETKEFRIDYRKAKLPLYPILKTLGVDDATLEKAWGKQILEANKSLRKSDSAVDQFYRTSKRGSAPSSSAEATKYLVDTFRQMSLRPDVTELTLGKPIDHVNGDALTRASSKMLKVQAGAPPDDRDSLVFKDLRSVGDFAYDKIMAAAPTIKSKILRKLNTAASPRDIIRFDVFDKPLRETFKKNAAAQVAKQVNPVEMVSTAQQTTVMGPGGIQSEQQILDEVKFVNPTHMGFLDPLHTPEGSRTGVTLRMPISVRKVGNEPQVPLYNVRTNKMEYVGPKTFLQSKIALPDQVHWESGRPTAKTDTVKISGVGNDVEEAKFKDVDYVMRHASQFFNITSNLIPFIGNTSGGRASMATRHMEQAISLKHREAPLVQVGTGGAKDGMRTFEEVVGTQASHQAHHAGVVKAIKDDAIIITDKHGHDHESQIYRNYPLNDAKSVLDSTPLVKVGDHVREGQTIADTNYSKNGTIALGTNLRVGYIPYKGYNFEDGIVISESAANKLASMHLHKHNVSVDEDTVLHKKRYISQHPSLYSRAQLEAISDDGVIRVGAKVVPGDPLVLSMKKTIAQDRVGLSALRKSLGEQYADKSLTWSGEAAGEVADVIRKGDEVIVHVKSVEPMQVGDKLAGRYGNKGIITAIIADKDMPHTPDGAHIEVALNPSGVPGRMNIGQVLETAASKIAKKTGTPYIVQNFSGGNQLEKVQDELKKHGISDTEDLFDPTTKQKLGHALVGFQHMVKLHHQVDKKVSVRSGMNLPGHDAEKYDSNLQPSGGGHGGGQSMDPLGLYSLLAHGARANIREMQTWKSEGPDPQTSPQKQWQSQHHDVWDAIQHGDPLPLPKPTFVFRKFTDMLAGAGVNMEKKGHQFILSPLTDSQIEHMTGDRVLPKPAELLYSKVDPKTGDPKPKPGGLFDEKLTGGHGGKKWSRMALAEPVPNPVFEDSIRIVSGLSKVDYEDVINGERAVSKQGHVVDLGHGATGGAGIKLILDKVDVAKELEAAKRELNAVAASKVDKVLKKVKRLQALKSAELTPSQAYVLHSLPILPPAMRPVTVMQDGNLNYADINSLYSQFAQNNDQLNDPTLKTQLTDHDKKELRKNLYDGMKAIMGVGIPYGDAEHKGLIHQISGNTPKTGFFQSTLISRKQDMSMRSTIVPEPSLALDEVGLPKEHALKLFAPFVVHQLKQSGVAENVAEAQKMVAKGTIPAYRALNRVMEERPVMLKRDPALHKYSIQAFRPRTVEGNAIKIHPLVTGGYNADFDGNCYTGSVEIVLRLRYKSSKEDQLTSLEDLYSMKFGSSSKIVCRDGLGVVLSTTLGELPLLGVPTKDKNGASVYGLPLGMEVWSYDHANGQPTFEPITHVTVEDNCAVATVKTRRFEVTASTNESLCVYDHATEEVVDLCPAQAIGRLSPVARRIPSEGIAVDLEIGWMIGAFVSDGWINTLVGYTKNSEAHRDRFTLALEHYIGGPVSYREYHALHGEDTAIEGASVKRHYSGLPVSLTSLFEECYRGTLPGRASLRKSLPPDVFNFSRAGLVGVLSGLFDGDGSLSISNSKNKPQPLAQYSTSSPTLRDDVLMLAQLLGIRASVSASQPKAGRVQKHTSYTINFSINDLREVAADLVVIEDKAYAAIQSILSGDGSTKDDLDIVPVPAHLMELCASSKGPCAVDPVLQRSLATNKSVRAAGYYVSRAVARRVLAHLAHAGINAAKWEKLVLATDVHWDVIVEVIPAGKEKVYDLVVPSTKVFVVNGGLVVWDTMSVFVPISADAVAEARKMFPSNNLFSEASGRVMYQPTLESALGLYKLTNVRTTRGPVPDMKHPADAIKAVQAGHISVNDKVHVGGQTTTTGRILLAAALPEPMQKNILTNFDFKFDKKGLDKVLTEVAHNHTADFGIVADKLKDIGNGASSGVVTVEHSQYVGANRLDPHMAVHVPVGVHTLGLDDFSPDVKTRESVLNPARKEAAKVKANKSLDSKESDRQLVNIWSAADRKIKEEHLKKVTDNPNNLLTMHLAGVKPGWGQYKQMTLAPMLVEDAAGRVIPTPITSSYAEGLDTGEYWTQMHGARRGSVLKVQQVRDPGYLSKLLMANTMDMLVTGQDCGTTRGISMPVTDRDVVDRYLQKDFSVKGMHVPAGTMLDSTLVSKMRAADKNAHLIVRSPLKCEHAKGLCQKCVGLSADGHHHELGDNVGVTSAQALGERAVQLTLRVFHTGGTVDTSGGSKVLGGFERFNQLMTLPKTIQDSATLAMRSGTVEKVENDATGVNVWVNGKKHHVGKDAAGNPLWKPLHASVATAWVPPAKGSKVEKGQQLSDPSRTLVNPHDLYKATDSIESVQNYLADQVYGLYKDEGIKRQHVETVVKAMSNLTKIDEPGDYDGVLRGEFHPTSVIHAVNRQLVKDKKQPILHTPVLKGVDMMPLSLREDWMAKLQHQRLSQTILEAAATLGKSDVHGLHPIPGMAVGSEFGLTKKHVQNRPALMHLNDVEEYAY